MQGDGGAIPTQAQQEFLQLWQQRFVLPCGPGEIHPWNIRNIGRVSPAPRAAGLIRIPVVLPWLLHGCDTVGWITRIPFPRGNCAGNTDESAVIPLHHHTAALPETPALNSLSLLVSVTRAAGTAGT